MDGMNCEEHGGNETWQLGKKHRAHPENLNTALAFSNNKTLDSPRQLARVTGNKLMVPGLFIVTPTYGPHEIKLQHNYMKTKFVARNNETSRLGSANFLGIKANKLSAKHAGGNLSVYFAFDPSEQRFASHAPGQNKKHLFILKIPPDYFSRITFQGFQ